MVPFTLSRGSLRLGFRMSLLETPALEDNALNLDT